MLEEIKERNNIALNELFNKYEIEKTVNILVKNYDSIFVSEEYIKENGFNTELKRAILYGNIKYVFVNNKIDKTNKKEILYNFGKKAMKGLSDKEVNLVLAELHLICCLIKQLKLILKIEIEESQILNIFAEI